MTKPRAPFLFKYKRSFVSLSVSHAVSQQGMVTKPPTNQILVSVGAKAAVTPASYATANGEFTGWNKPSDTTKLFAVMANKKMQA